jgi:hypothetical protein
VLADAAAVRGVIGFAGQFAAVDPNLTGAWALPAPLAA